MGRNVWVAWGSGYERSVVTVVSTESIRVGTIGTETIRITESMAVECDSGFSICFRFGISRPLAQEVTISVSATVKSVAVVSTIVSAVSKTVSVSTAVVSTVVGGGGLGISLGFGLGGHDGEKSNGENGEIFHVADYQAIGFVRRTPP